MRLEVRHVMGTFGLNCYDEPDDEYDASIVKLWNSLPPLLLRREYLHENCKVAVSMDWIPLRDFLTKQLRTSTRMPKAIRMPAQVEISGRHKFSKHGGYSEFFC
jgi:hypothetical protein